tara:strand:- start:224 stop:652 length:429 start_codon:yes stop_codon:yes gene_type:complete
MRDISEIIIHCSATREGQNIDAETIDEWHKARGWRGIGYHYVVLLDGLIEYGRPVNDVGAHCKGHNSNSIGVCYIGGVEQDGTTPKDTRTCEQKEALILLIRVLKLLHPDATIYGHRDFSDKACPSFDATQEYEGIGSKENL